MTKLTNDEIAVLQIMHGDEEHAGHNVLAIGRWEKPCKDLAARGLARCLDAFNHVITPAGSKALLEHDGSSDRNTAAILAEINITKKQGVQLLEDAAQALVKACQTQNRLTGEVPNQVAFNMGQAIIRRALEILAQ